MIVGKSNDIFCYMGSMRVKDQDRWVVLVAVNRRLSKSGSKTMQRPSSRVLTSFKKSIMCQQENQSILILNEPSECKALGVSTIVQKAYKKP